jgi:hypothetical protein
VTTALGFFAVIPTGYLGVAELGWISGCGMFVILFLVADAVPGTPERRPESRVGSRRHGGDRSGCCPPLWTCFVRDGDAILGAPSLLNSLGPQARARVFWDTLVSL